MDQKIEEEFQADIVIGKLILIQFIEYIGIVLLITPSVIDLLCINHRFNLGISFFFKSVYS